MSKSSRSVVVFPGLLTILFGAAPLSASPAIPAAGRGIPWAHLQEARPLAMIGGGETAAILAAQARPTALAAADFDEDGVPDLVAGFAAGPGGVLALLRGNVDSIHPHALEAKARRAAGRSVEAPFLPDARMVPVPVSPEFVGAGDFDADGHADVVLADRGSAMLFVLAGDGRGGLGPATRVALAGPVTALAVGEVNRRDGLPDIVVGLGGPQGARLAVLEGPDGAARSLAEEVPLPESAAALVLGEFDGARGIDIAVAVGRKILLVAGRDRRLSLDDEERGGGGATTVAAFALPVAPLAMAAGNFVDDVGRRDDLAILGGDGVLRLLVPDGAGLALQGEPLSPSAFTGGSPRLARARTSGLPTDDLVVVDRAGGAIRLFHGGAGASAGRAGDSATLDVEGTPIDLLPMSLGFDSLEDLIVLKEGAEPLVAAITAPLATFVVNSTNDVNDGSCGAHCSLREAILAANASGGVDQISFAIGTGAKTISPTSPLPDISGVTIDGTTQPGFAGTPLIEIDGQGAGFTAGLVSNTGTTAIKGLVVNRFSGAGIRLLGASNSVSGSYIGTDLGGSIDLGNAGAGIDAVYGDTIVGGTTTAARNVISGNIRGISVGGSGTTILGNYIGTNAAGTAALGNDVEGILIDDTTGLGATVGSAVAGGRNVISGNDEGISSYGSDFIAQANLIGTSAAGTASLGNSWTGILSLGAITAQIGGTGAGAGNVVSGNTVGIQVSFGASAVQIQGNRVGTNAAGTAARSNGQDGISVISSPGVVIGGTAAGARNVVSGNTLSGVVITDSDDVKVQGNFVGLDLAGQGAIGNLVAGIRITGTSASCRIGGTTSAARNVVSGNGGAGIVIDASGSGQMLQGNVIGADPTRTIPLGNGTSGLLVTNGSWNVIGGSLGGANWFWWNGTTGLTIAPSSVGNTISMNSFRDNTGLALDLGGDGVTANDPLDADSGANGLPNTPVLDAVVVDSGTVVAGHYQGAPMASVTLEFFASSECDYLGRGEGTTYLGSALVSTNSEGDASFVTTLATLVAPGNVVTATAIDADGQTSEFSGCRAVTGPQLVFGATSLADGTGNGNGAFDLSECVQLSVTLRNIGGSAATNVRATLAANTAGIVVGQPSGSWANLAGGASGTNVIPFTVSAVAPVACGGTVDLVLTVTAAEGTWVVPFSLVVGRVRYSATGPVAIPDNTPAGVDLPLVVPPTAGTITNVVASLHVTHSYDADLVLSLRHPDGTEVLLAARRGGGGDHYGSDCPAGPNDTSFDGSALSSIVGGAAPFVGTWRPEGNLSAFVGKSPTGTWRLRVVDVAATDTGSIQCWSLSFATGSTCTAAPGACSAPAGEPNPLVWENGSETSLAWGAAANALGYHVYRGASIDLPKVLDGRPDSCLAAATTSLATGNVLTTTPAAGDFDWYLVRAIGPIGEGPAGNSSSGAEVQDSRGSCP